MLNKQPKEGLKYLVRRELGPDFTVDEAAEFIHHTTAGIYSMHKRDPKKLQALFIGYKTIAEQETNQQQGAA